MYELTLGPIALAMLEWLNADKLGTVSLSDDSKRMYEAWLLSDAIVPTERTLALTDTELDPVYVDGGDSLGIGWAYSRQKWGSTLEETTKASIVTIATSIVGGKSYISRHYHLTFAADGGVLSASLNLEEQSDSYGLGPNGTEGGPIWYPTVSGFEIKYCWFPDGSDLTLQTLPAVDAPVYCYWADHEERVLRFNTDDATSSVASGSWSGMEVCGTGSDSKSRSTTRSTTLGGPYMYGEQTSSRVISHSDAENKDLSVYATGGKCTAGDDSYATSSRWLFWITANYCEYPTACWPYGWYGQNYAPVNCNTPLDILNPPKGKFVQDLVGATENYHNEYRTLFSHSRIAIITSDPEVVYTYDQSHVTGGITDKQWIVTNGSHSPDGFSSTGEWSYTDIFGTKTTESYKRRFGGVSSFSMAGNAGAVWDPSGGGGGQQCSLGTGIGTEALNPATTSSSELIDDIHLDINMYTATGSVSLDDYDNWASWEHTGFMVCQGRSVDARLSYWDNSGVYTLEKSNWTSTETPALPFNTALNQIIFLGAV